MFSRISAAILLAPETALAQAISVSFAVSLGFNDALGALAPPEVGLHLVWPDGFRVNGALCGALRAVASTGETTTEPDWLVIGLSLIGVVTGLAWTSVGGDLLHIEALRLPGKGRMKTTGKLGDVMKESIDAASSFVRSISPQIGVKPPEFEKLDIHVHVPDGATPKDGPSAGLAMVTSIVSVLTKIPVRKDIAMTGEVSLRGNAMPIGGLKEKLLAALRGGIKTVMIPKENEKDLADIPDNVKDGLEIIAVEHVWDVLKVALTEMPEGIEWDEAAEAAAAQAALSGDTGAGATAH